MELYTTKCKRCGKPIIFIRTVAGKSMPCNSMPEKYILNENGLRRLILKNGRMITCDVVDGNKYDGWGYVPHWGDCISNKK